VRLRASQINGCAYCVDTHSTDAASAGESSQRINAVAVWHESPFFTEREHAALRFTEVVTRVADTRVPQEEYDALAAHWSSDEVGALLALIVTINAWNALAVASRAWEPVLAD
jgi:AhpD family alkylhydroperoxidase